MTCSTMNHKQSKIKTFFLLRDPIETIKPDRFVLRPVKSHDVPRFSAQLGEDSGETIVHEMYDERAAFLRSLRFLAFHRLK